MSGPILCESCCAHITYPADDYCFGCNSYICTTCCEELGHMTDGEHGKKPLSEHGTR